MAATNNFDVYDFEKIIRHKEVCYGTLYLVKWKGYSDKYNTWEPQENFVRQDIEDFMERQRINLLKRIKKSEKMSAERKTQGQLKLGALQQQVSARNERKLRRECRSTDFSFDEMPK